MILKESNFHKTKVLLKFFLDITRHFQVNFKILNRSFLTSNIFNLFLSTSSFPKQNWLLTKDRKHRITQVKKHYGRLKRFRANDKLICVFQMKQLKCMYFLRCDEVKVKVIIEKVVWILLWACFFIGCFSQVTLEKDDIQQPIIQVSL